MSERGGTLAAAGRPRRRRRPAWGTLWRYTGSSVVAALCSEVTLVVLYGLLHVSTGWASSLAWLAGALPNYWLNRSWAWRLRGRPSLRHEVLPYVVIVAVTLLLAWLGTTAVDRWLRTTDVSGQLRVALVAGTFLGVYVLMFVLRFALLDRLFTRRTTPEAQP